ncbi:MAG: multiheme c-type cytochrome, partial [Planctomycetota bacterium]
MYIGLTVGLGFASLALVHAAEVVPNEIQQPGTQPNEVQNFESPDKCDNCHGGYDEARAYSNEPAFGWRGSAMGNAGRDPIFWATLAIAEQDFDGAGDLCIRCHSTGGWYAGRSTPTDGSGLAAGDDDGVDCDTCHKVTNP